MLDAFRRVPRHDFVDEFGARAVDAPAGEGSRRWVLDRGDPDEATLAAIYQPDQALGLRTDAAGTVTSTVSAPGLIASMLEQAELRPGLRVLEIGTGSGYNAALLAHLVAPSGHVTTIDIDEELIAEARRRLERDGRGAIDVRAGDGFLGAADRAPFDRLIATVGCTDLSPHWIDQLDAAGSALVPLQHGGLHPVVQLRPDGDGGAVGRVVSNAAFVDILGALGGQSPWLAPGRLGPTDGVTHDPVPDEVLASLQGATSWDVSFFVSLLDPRGAHALSLNDGAGSSAALLPHRRTVAHAGPAGRALARDLLDHVRTWAGLGRPGPGDCTIRLVPIVREAAVSAPAGGWTIRRSHFVEHVGLG